MNNTNYKYKKINSLLKKISFNNDNFNRNSDIKNKLIKNRILQIISTEILDFYNKKLFFDNFKIDEFFKINLKKIYIYKLFLIYFFRSIFFILFCLLNLYKKKSKRKINLIEIDSIRNKKIYNNTIGFLNDNTNIFHHNHFYIYGGFNWFHNKHNSKYFIVRNNIFNFLIINSLEYNDRKKLIIEILKQIPINFRLIKKSSLNVLVLDDFLKLSIIKKTNLNDLIVTSNRVRNTPLWLNYHMNKKCNSKMIWLGDSALSLPRLFKNNNYSNKKSVIPFYKFIKVDQHIVWNKNFELFLKKNFNLSQSIYNYQKPIIYKPLKKYKKYKKNLFIFDNNPKFKGFNGTVNNYVSLENVNKFVNDICDELNLSNNNTFKVFIKRKKYLTKVHETPLYLKYIDNLKKISIKFKNIKLIDEHDDYLKYLNSSKICICFPFSSSSNVSNFYNIKTFFYDPTGNLVNNFYNKKLPLISSRKKLKNILSQYFNKK